MQTYAFGLYIEFAMKGERRMTELNDLKKLPFWEKLSKDEQDLVQSSSSIKHYTKNQIIYNCGTDCLGLTMVLSGELRTSILSEEGREITLYRLHKEELCVISASCVVNQITFDSQMAASEDCDLLVIGIFAFEQLTKQNIYVRCFMYELLSERFSSVMWTMQMILFKGYDRRLASFLIDEYEHTGLRTIKMTHEQIAQYTNSAREVVARMLKRFASEGLVVFQRGCITLTDIDALRQMN